MDCAELGFLLDAHTVRKLQPSYAGYKKKFS